MKNFSPQGLSTIVKSDSPGWKNGVGTEKPSWVNQAFPYHELIQILNYYLDLECWIIDREDWDDWHCLRKPRRPARPADYDHLYGKKEERNQFNRACFERVLREKKTLCADRRGVSHFFVPILRRGEVAGFLQCGDFLAKSPTREALRGQWKELTGYTAPDSNGDFLRYARVLLETPLLEGAPFKALQEVLELYAQVLAGEGDSQSACRRVRELRTQVFAREFHHLWWLEKVIQNNQAPSSTWFHTHTRLWAKEELGLERFPTTVLALAREEAPEETLSDLERVLENHRFQRELFKLTRDFPQTLPHPLEDYGLLLFTSLEPGQKEAREKVEILDLLDRLSKFTTPRFRTALLAGVGRCQAPGDSLSQACRQAVISLGLCRTLGRPTFFYEDLRDNPSLPEPANFYEWSLHLTEACLRGSGAQAEAARNQYVAQILSHSAGRAENIRLHFFYAFGQIVEGVKKRLPLEKEPLLVLSKEFEGRLQEAQGAPELTGLFEDSLRRLLDLTLKPVKGSQNLRLEAARRYIDDNFDQDLKLEQVARANGFSVSVFGRAFKRVLGMGFSSYLRRIRLERAKNLLLSTPLPISQVCQQCGFQNLQYFFDLFKRSTGQTPQEFRNRFSHKREGRTAQGEPEA